MQYVKLSFKIAFSALSFVKIESANHAYKSLQKL